MREFGYWNFGRWRESIRRARRRGRNGPPLSDMAASQSKPSRLALIAAFGAVYLIWGSTYLGIKYAIETIPPLLMAGSRFIAAGALLCVWSWWRGRKTEKNSERSQWAHWRTAIVVGAMLFLVGNGGVTWAEGRLASSIAALLVATEPLWIVLLNWSRPNVERPSLKTFLGLAVGFVGVWYLISPAKGDASSVDVVGAAAVIGAAFSWAAGSIYSLRAPAPRAALMAAGMPMIAGGALLIIAGLLMGEWSRLDVSNISLRSIIALAYLILFGSVVAFTAYSWLLHVVAPARVATYAYVNPVVAVVLGWALGGETMTTRMLFGAAVIVVAVGLITSRRHQATADDNASPRIDLQKYTEARAGSPAPLHGSVE